MEVESELEDKAPNSPSIDRGDPDFSMKSSKNSTDPRIVWEKFLEGLESHGLSVADLQVVLSKSVDLIFKIAEQQGVTDPIEKALLLRQLDQQPKYPADLTGMDLSWREVVMQGNMSAEEVYDRFYADYSTWGIVSALITSFLVPLLFESPEIANDALRVCFRIGIVVSAFSSIFALLTELTVLGTLAGVSKPSIFAFMKHFGNMYVWHGVATYLAILGLVFGYIVKAAGSEDPEVAIAAISVAGVTTLLVLYMRKLAFDVMRKACNPKYQAWD
eukprot:gb/GEZN01014706.1/.p1 GENE.gb/GEZN01014706.1/~~gb/GEZN01014706.1/.p1  ORF type:complete len:274 (-),score=39.80 gb/GEZN01014706.1/:77-898(-)